MITIEAFVWYRHLTENCGRRIAPVSPVEAGFMTFSERELASFFYTDPAMKEPLLSFVREHWQRSAFSQADITNIWLQGQKPGVLIKRFIAEVAQEKLTARQRGRASVAASVKLLTLQEIEDHVNNLRDRKFVPEKYDEKGYILRGSKQMATDSNILPSRCGNYSQFGTIDTRKTSYLIR